MSDIDDTDPDARPVTPNGYRLQGAILTALAFTGALSLGGLAGYHAIANSVPPEPPMVFRGADGESITVEDLVDEAEPVMRKFVNAEVPWLLRHPAHAMLRWSLRSHVKTAIAIHGHHVSSALKVVEPMSNTLFRPEPAARIRGLRRLCDTPISEFGSVAVEARESAGPADNIGR